MSAIPQDVFQWLTAISVPITASALIYVGSLNKEFIVLSTQFKAAQSVINDLVIDQKQTNTTVALQGQTLGKVQTDLSGINAKLDILPRIATQLESIVPQLGAVVPRVEVEHRFRNIEQALEDLKHMQRPFIK